MVLSLHLRRRYYFYMVNLVVPCSLIALMVLLSFILPPESGERIGLGITVLMAMAIFQELTSNKLPADSNYIPLLGNGLRLTAAGLSKGGVLDVNTATATRSSKSNRFLLAKQVCTGITLFCTFLCRHCTTTT